MSDTPLDDADGDLRPTELLTTAVGPSSTGSTVQIGPYRLLDKLGEGGMGEVWLAEQSEPVRRKVALKVIKQGMDTKEVVARFEAEKQALALMDHPAIAKVYDAGATPTGRPFFVMEHVKGVPITEHCDRHRLTNRQRLDLFMKVCEGVQHAHQKAVIHRDLKPGNVLVSIRDEEPVPKIIDFGVAKATAQKLTEQTMHTQFGVMIGTPAYMSPEQAEMTGQGIDTRTDVYALGVILYELLVGALPFDMRDFHQAGFEAMVRKIREDEPPKPSIRLSTLGEQSAQPAKNRRTDPATLKRELSGDLDWITMKALEKDRTRRYSSPQDLAADIERYLTDQPVLACPPSTAYRATKFVRRHRGGVAVAAITVVVLIGFAVTMTVQAGRIGAERDRANAEATRANQEAEAKGLVSEFMKNLFTVSDPSEARGNSITARELLDAGAKKIATLDDGETRAELMATIGLVYRKLGLYPQAEEMLDGALAERRRMLGKEHTDTLNSMKELAILYKNQGHYAEAEVLQLESLQTKKRVLGDRHPETFGSMNSLALLYKEQGRYDKAESLFLAALEARKSVLGEDHSDTLDSLNHLAVLYYDQGRYEEAEPLYLDTLEIQRRVNGDDHPVTLNYLNNLALLYKSQGRNGEAEAIFVETLKTQRRVLGDDHPDTLKSVNNLAELYRIQKRYAEAEPLFVETLGIRERVLGDDHPSTGISVHNLACLYRELGRYEESQRYFKWAQQIWEAKLDPDHPHLAENLAQWAVLLRKTGDDAGADRLLAP